MYLVSTEQIPYNHLLSVLPEQALKSNIPVVTVAQLVESRIVIPVVAGSIPVSHPNTPSYNIPQSPENIETMRVSAYSTSAIVR